MAFKSISLAAITIALSSSINAAVILDNSFFNINDTTIDFETYPSISGTVPDGSALSSQYASIGVLFSSEDNPNVLQSTDATDSSGRFDASFQVLASVSGGGAPTSGVRYASGDQYIGLSTSDMRIDFTSAVNAFGMFVIDNDFTTARIQAFDSTGDLLETVVVPQSNEGGVAYYGIDVSGTGNLISYFILDGNNGVDLDSTFIDDLSFRVVPLPASVWLFSWGIIGLIGIARRKKA